MAKQTINRKAQLLPMDMSDESDVTDVPEKQPKEKKVSSTKKKVSKKRVDASAKEVRLKAFWAIYSSNFQHIESFEYGDKEAAEKRAAELTEQRKLQHYVRMEKRVIES